LVERFRRGTRDAGASDQRDVVPLPGLSDSPELSYELTLPDVPAGEHTIAVRAEDE
jgi:hypothetical protein